MRAKYAKTICANPVFFANGEALPNGETLARVKARALGYSCILETLCMVEDTANTDAIAALVPDTDDHETESKFIAHDSLTEFKETKIEAFGESVDSKDSAAHLKNDLATLSDTSSFETVSDPNFLEVGARTLPFDPSGPGDSLVDHNHDSAINLTNPISD